MKPTTDQIRQSIPAPLLATLEAARDRLGARLQRLETPTLTAGRRPWWWQGDWR
jgi:hypothetical protein